MPSLSSKKKALFVAAKYDRETDIDFFFKFSIFAWFLYFIQLIFPELWFHLKVINSYSMEYPSNN